jgi:RNA polymerase sigma-B factor
MFGDAAARARLVELYLPLVRVLAARHAGRGEPLEDLVQIGSIGLIEAIDRFDPQRGRGIAAFAIPTIDGRIRNHLRDRAAVVRLPRRIQMARRKLHEPRARLIGRLQRPPTASELAEETGLPEADVVAALDAERSQPLSLSRDVPGSGLFADVTSDDDALDQLEDRLFLAEGFRTLRVRERRILHLRFFADLSQADIAREMGISQIHVSRLIRASLERLGSSLGARSTHAPESRRAGAL